jgi:uncharacterized protein (DUF433 family)
MDLAKLVEAKPDVMMGKPCLAGTRIPVYVVLEKLAASETEAQVLSAFPQLRPEHITAALQYAAQLAS